MPDETGTTSDSESTGNGGPIAALGPAAAPVATPTPQPAKRYRASIHSRPEVLPVEFVSAVQDLEKAMGVPVWLLIQNEEDDKNPWGLLAHEVFDGFFKQRHLLKKTGGVALLLDSPGGSAKYAYKLAKLLRNHASTFTAVVPHYAKSGATVLALGADQIILAQDAELGPLDAQLYDAEREEFSSALNEVQALARLSQNSHAHGSVMCHFPERKSLPV